MVLLKNHIPWWRIQYTEQDAQCVAQAIISEHVSLGPITTEFEVALAKRLNVPYVVATTSGSMALLMALLALGVGPGDEVIVPNRTWIAAAHAVMMVGAKVILVDVKADVPIIDTSLIESKITSRTRAIIPTPLNGRAIDKYLIDCLAKKYDLYVIEDAAQAMFSQSGNIYMGTNSDIGCFSLSIAKLIPTGQGGFIVTRDEHLYESLRKIRTHGVGDLMDCNFSRFGFNFRFTDLQASLGLAQLAKVDEKITALNKIYDRYECGLADCQKVRLIPVQVSSGELPLYIEVLCKNRNQFLAFLHSENIQAKIFYPNLNRAAYLNSTDLFGNANRFELEGLVLPSGPDQFLCDIQRVLECIWQYEKTN